jgi:tripartite-type tricarboxylate transporter receptor subunit TctC
MKSKAISLPTAALLLAAVLVHNAADAQAYPSKAVRIIVPFPPAAGGDFVTRLFANRLGESLGQQFVVDNRGGASGNIGAEVAARAAPDGYTLLTVSITLAVAQSLYTKLNYDLIRDFEPIAAFATTPYVLAVNPAVRAANVRELIALAKSQPGKVMFGSAGEGSGSHLAGERFKMQAGIDILHVPYKGTAPAISGLIGGEISMIFATQVLPQVRTGRLRALAVTSDKRSQIAPDLPTVSESGVPGYQAGIWFGLVAPAKTSREIVRRLNAEINRISQAPDIRNQLMTQSSGEAMSGTPEQFGAYIRDEVAQGRKIIAAAGLHAQ